MKRICNHHGGHHYEIRGKGSSCAPSSPLFSASACRYDRHRFTHHPNYESGERLPKQKESYELLAAALNVELESLKDDNADFVIKATEKYGSRGHEQAERLIKEVSGLYAGGELAEEDMDAMMKAIQEAYWIAKEKNRKFVPKKYRSTSDSNSDS